MNRTVADILSFLCDLAPLTLQLDFDNSGLLIGSEDRAVERILLSLDITEAVVKEAVNEKADLIIAHHPVIFHPLKDLKSRPENKKILLMIHNGISAICMHTNLDIADGGVNDVLLECFSAKKESALCTDGLGRVGELHEPIPLEAFLSRCKRILHANGLRYISSGKDVRRIAVLGGSGASAIRDAYEKNCDTFLTADIKYHDFMLAEELGLNLIDGDHFCTEDPVMDMLAMKLNAQFDDLHILKSRLHKQIVQFY